MSSYDHFAQVFFRIKRRHLVSNTKFDFWKPWRMDDLPEELRKLLEEENDFEPGATYIGGEEVDVVFEVPHCPHCGIGFYKTHRCEHLVCVYDSTNGEYLEVVPSFKKYALNTMHRVAHVQTAAETESIAEALTDIQEGRFPTLNSLAGAIKGFSFHEVFDVSGAHGLGCGYVDDFLLRVCSIDISR
ncbi:hypothetical protein IH575_03290 [Candidatus Dojkabacteria bacterium]|nr:hypothetical protein [Candidatus Dojkabacteria bacterium]